MSRSRRNMSTSALTGIAVLALCLLGSAPAASGRQGAARAIQIHGADATRQAQVERLRNVGIAHGNAPRIDSRLAAALRARRVGGQDAAERAGLAFTRDGRARLVVEWRRPASVQKLVTDLGGSVERSWRNLVEVAMPPREIEALSLARGVDLVRAPYAHVEHAVAGEEVAASLSSAWHAKGFTGEGVKIAVIDGGFRGLSERQAAGELPANVVTSDFCGGNFATEDDHGTAVAEIVHETAPDAQLFALCVDSEVGLAAAVDFARSQGVNVINHSMGWAGPWRGDGSGPVGAIVSSAKASGILWVNSAGNEGASHWSGTYSPGPGKMHVWAEGDQGNTFVLPSGVEVCGFLRWEEWPAGVSDFDLGLFLSGANVLLSASAGDQTGSQPPFEGLCYEQSTGVDLMVFWAIGGYRVTSSPRLDLESWSPPLQYWTAEGSIADPASSPAALAVGAICWQSRQLEFYSSQGPTIDGRMKPELVGHDSVSGSTYGAFSSCPSAFAGTSASSPEVAGAAALVKQAFPAYGPDQLQQYLRANALDLGAPGADNATGAGELRMPKPPDVVAPSAKAMAAAGRRGATVKLVSRVADDSGEVRIVEQVKRNGRVVATLSRSGFVAAPGLTTVTLAWKAPAKAAGSYQHCVRATDRAGNTSAVSCAKVALR